MKQFYIRKHLDFIFIADSKMLQSDNFILNLWVYFQLMFLNFLPELLSFMDHANFCGLECEEEE